MTRHLGLLLLLAPWAAAAAAPRPAVVELFTSEGCSDCPPAEALLGELARRPDVLALAFHVDYWDKLGWPDRFELRYADERQARYARAFGLTSVFTPQIVIEAHKSLIGADRGGIDAELKSAREGVPVTLAVHEGRLSVGVDAGEGTGEVLLLAYSPQVRSAILRGENAGRTLTEFNVVRAVKVLGRWQGAKAQFALPLAELPTDATRVAVLVQRPEQGAIVAAVDGALPQR